MRRVGLIIGLICLFFVGCSSIGMFPYTSSTQVRLSKDNYRIVKANVIGVSRGFSLFGFISIVPASYTNATTDLCEKAGFTEGKALAMANVTQERSDLYLILFSISTLTIRSDIVEFTGKE